MKTQFTMIALILTAASASAAFAASDSAALNLTVDCQNSIQKKVQAYVEADWDFGGIRSVKATHQTKNFQGEKLTVVQVAVVDGGMDEGDFDVYVTAKCGIRGIMQTLTFTP